MNFKQELVDGFKHGTIIVRLIYINVAIFILVNILQLFSIDIVRWLAVPDNLDRLVRLPWSLITYMFLHQDLWHILFNMVGLYWFGIIFLQYLKSKQLLGVYILGGLSGAFLYILSFNLIPNLWIYSSAALGASAAVMAIVIAATMLNPDTIIHLLLLGPVKIKYITIVTVGIDIFSIFASDNIGGHIAHIGGAFFGYVFVVQLRKKRDLTIWITSIIDWIFGWIKPKPKMKITYKQQKSVSDKDYNKRKHVNQEEVDRILDKISRSGYESLTREEKEILFRMSAND